MYLCLSPSIFVSVSHSPLSIAVCLFLFLSLSPCFSVSLCLSLPLSLSLSLSVAETQPKAKLNPCLNYSRSPPDLQNFSTSTADLYPAFFLLLNLIDTRRPQATYYRPISCLTVPLRFVSDSHQAETLHSLVARGPSSHVAPTSLALLVPGTSTTGSGRLILLPKVGLTIRNLTRSNFRCRM